MPHGLGAYALRAGAKWRRAGRWVGVVLTALGAYLVVMLLLLPTIAIPKGNVELTLGHLIYWQLARPAIAFVIAWGDITGGPDLYKTAIAGFTILGVGSVLLFACSDAGRRKGDRLP